MFGSIKEYFLVIFLLFAGALGLSLALTRLMIALLPRWGMVDKPDFKRHIHTIATPRGGGIGMMAAFLCLFAGFFLLYPGAKGFMPEFVRSLLPLCILLPLGILDDRLGLGSGTKFIFQIATACLAWYFGVRINTVFALSLPAWASLAITVFWITAFINAFNMIDGVDGLASGVASISTCCMAFIAATQHSHGDVCFLVIFLGALLGFLYFNWHPASVFMGDSGAMCIGYILAVTGVGLNARFITMTSICIPLLACGVPVLDICLAVWRRLFISNAMQASENSSSEGVPPVPPQNFIRRLLTLLKRLGTADRRHLHHRFLNAFNNNQRKAVLRIYLIAAFMGIAAIVCACIPGKEPLLAVILIIGTFSVVICRLATLELWNSPEEFYQYFHTARLGRLLSHVIHPCFDLCSIALITFWASRSTFFFRPFYITEHVAVVIIVLLLSRIYRIIWNNAISSDYFRLLFVLCLGNLLSWLIGLFFFACVPGWRFLAAAGVGVALILGERLSLQWGRNYILARRNRQIAPTQATITTVICGVSPLARCYRDQLCSTFGKPVEEQVLGLVTAERRFLHGICYGMEVLAMLDDLEALYRKKSFQKLVVACGLVAKDLATVQEVCEAHGIQLVQISIQQAPPAAETGGES